NALNVRTHVERDLLKLVDICLHVGYACYKSMIITPCCISVLCDVKSYEGFVDTMTECKVKWYYGKLEERFRTLPSSDQRVQALKKFRTLLTEVGILDDPQNITTTSTKTDTYHSAKKKNPLKFPRK
uniref:Uncharacterized protein n=1 Tax=Acrobeloides nanus TaxID=290746 RepID=A0A914CVP3_9BILA